MIFAKITKRDYKDEVFTLTFMSTSTLCVNKLLANAILEQLNLAAKPAGHVFFLPIVHEEPGPTHVFTEMMRAKPIFSATSVLQIDYS